MGAASPRTKLELPPAEEKREEMIDPRGTGRQPRNQRVKMKGRPKAAGPEETRGERALSGNETSCPCQPFLDSKQVSSGIGIKHQSPVSSLKICEKSLPFLERRHTAGRGEWLCC